MKQKIDPHIPFEELIRDLPENPGVYLMRNSKGEVIYVGKAKNILKRVRSYFTGVKDLKTSFLVKKISSIESIITDTEYEALLLENNLIKKWKPHYNIDLKDGKTYPVIRITKEEYPRLFRTRRVVQDGSSYFGPYPNAQSIDKYLALSDKISPLRKCKGTLKKREHPCLYYHIGKCSAPCAGKISREEYGERVEKVRDLLRGKTDDIIKTLKLKMEQASSLLQFEKAAEFRDSLEAIKTIEEEQHIQDFDTERRDYIGFEFDHSRYVFSVFQMRGGKLFVSDLFRTETWSSPVFRRESGQDLKESLEEFLMQYYDSLHEPPETVFVQIPAKYSNVEGYLAGKYGHPVNFKFTDSGKDGSILRLSRANSFQELEKWKRKTKREELLQEVRAVLKLPRIPRRIEGFDIAQLEGKHPVASMVAFYNGKPDKRNYRRYHIKTVKGRVDDYESIREVVARRYTRILNEGLPVPDLVLIDGGKGQVSAAHGILSALGLKELPVIGLAKKKEELFSPGDPSPICLPEGSEVLKLMQHVRDEAHRFASSFNKRLRQKTLNISELEKISGIGRKRSILLLTTFGSAEEIRKRTPEEIAALLGVGKERAVKILEEIMSAPDRGIGEGAL